MRRIAATKSRPLGQRHADRESYFDRLPIGINLTPEQVRAACNPAPRPEPVTVWVFGPVGQAR